MSAKAKAESISEAMRLVNEMTASERDEFWDGIRQQVRC